jgi:hypothetical protein
MKMSKAAFSARPRQRGTTPRRITPGATAPDPDELLEFLSEPVEDPEDEALIRFPGRFAIHRYGREAFIAIASARANSAAGSAWLASAREAIGFELLDGNSGPTLTEDAVRAGSDRLAAAIQACRRAGILIRRARQLVPRSRCRRLRMVSGDA